MADEYTPELRKALSPHEPRSMNGILWCRCGAGVDHGLNGWSEYRDHLAEALASHDAEVARAGAEKAWDEGEREAHHATDLRALLHADIESEAGA